MQTSSRSANPIIQAVYNPFASDHYPEDPRPQPVSRVDEFDVRTNSSEEIPILEEDLNMLRKQYAKEQDIQRKLEREREAEVRRNIDEREMLLRNIHLLRERNRKAATKPWQPEITKDLGDLRRGAITERLPS